MEEWRIIGSFPNYEASNLGNVRHIKRQKNRKTYPLDLSRGYGVVGITYMGKKYTKKVARLIWEAFNDKPCDMTIDHIDRDATNNKIENLRCISCKENANHRLAQDKGNKYNFTNEDKTEIITKITKKELSVWEVMKKYNVPMNYIYTIIKRGTWKKYINESGTI
jgi:hypothetical protein